MHIISKQGSMDNVLTYEHICDTIADMNNIEKRYITLGSTCIVLSGSTNALEAYMADSNKEWHELLVNTNGEDGSYSTNPDALIHTDSVQSADLLVDDGIMQVQEQYEKPGAIRIYTNDTTSLLLINSNNDYMPAEIDYSNHTITFFDLNNDIYTLSIDDPEGESYFYLYDTNGTEIATNVQTYSITINDNSVVYLFSQTELTDQGMN